MTKPVRLQLIRNNFSGLHDMLGATPVEEWPTEIDEPVEIFVVHDQFHYATSPKERREWCGWFKGRWTDFNRGGWTWMGMCGRVVFVRPIVEDNA